ncbi:hypothetical protein F511_01707 [Dorcoceras hygrometricum]|nr:hypothetical protein F511_01707 [Dorcoceras hygrometricum]
MADISSMRSKGYAAQICVLLKGDPAVTLEEAKPFPPLKILSAKAVGTYVAMNKTIDACGESYEPEVAKVAVVKRKSVSKKRSASTANKDTDEVQVEIVAEKAVSKKRPDAASKDTDEVQVEIVAEKAVSKKRPDAASDAPAIKKKMTPTGRAAPTEKDLALVTVAQDAAPIQIVEPISAVPAERPHAEKRKTLKRKLRLSTGSDDEIVDKEPDVETVVEKQKEQTIVDDVDKIIDQVINKTAQMETDVVEPDVAETMESVTAPKQFLKEPLRSGEDDYIYGFEQPNDLLKQIPEDMMLPSVTAAEPTKIKFGHGITINGAADGDWYKASLPKFAVADKGKAPLVDPDTVKGNPAREMVHLICRDIEFLVHLREKVIDEVAAFFNSFSLRRLAVLKSVRKIAAKEEQVLTWAETDSVQFALQRRLYIVAKYRELLLRKFLEAHPANFSFGQHWSAMALQIIDLLSAAHNLVFAYPVVQVDADNNADSVFADQVVQMEGYQHPDPTESDKFSHRISDIAFQSPNLSTSTDSRMLFTNADITLNDETVVYQLVLPATALPASVLVESLAQLRTFVTQLSIKQMRTKSSIGNLKNELLSKIDNIEKAAAEARTQHDHVFRDLIKSVKQEVHKTVLSLEMIEFNKGVRDHSAIVTTDLEDIRKEMHEQKATLSQEMDDKLKAVQDQQAALSHDLMEFHVQAQENYNNLTFQLSELVDYINRGGDAKKGGKW